ncbi:hypothetical protein HYU23_02775 [Candidatus Woesearchaeota archaeon]|nr:hypothetical protein [Candidatus Woesearchaeota archaeon]
MEVKIAFDTEKESIEDLKRLIVALQDLINKREKANSLGNPIATSNLTKPSQVKVEQKEVEKPVQAPATGQTSGGGRVIPYEDMSDLLSKIVSGKH